jgi:glycogen debranching enzyme
MESKEEKSREEKSATTRRPSAQTAELPAIDADPSAIDAAWDVLERCAEGGSGIRAAAGSTLYPHLWTRDAAIVSLGVLAARRSDADLELVCASLRTLAKHQHRRGRMPLKVDLAKDLPVAENAAGVDGGLWYVLVVEALLREGGAGRAEPFIEPALRALEWTQHLDVNGCGLLETPEASDWADMMPHQHNVLYVNALFCAALRAGARLVRHGGEKMRATYLRAQADEVRRKLNLLFWLEGCTTPRGVRHWLRALEREYPEWGLTGTYLARAGELPFYLPYVGFRRGGGHCDVVGNLVAILAGVAPPERARRILDHLDQVGAAWPWPSRTVDPPIYPGDPDWREHFRWRNLNLPYQYQNGGCWPYVGALHALAALATGRREEAATLTTRLEEACRPGGRWVFPEWRHGRSGAAMGEVDQAWSASGLLHARAALRRGEALVWPSPEARGEA